jgi:hypothetical protein
MKALSWFLDPLYRGWKRARINVGSARHRGRCCSRGQTLVVEQLEPRTLRTHLGMVPDHILRDPLRTANPAEDPFLFGYTPAQIRHAYAFDQVAFNQGTVPGDGRGQTIAIVDAFDAPTITGDLHAFDQQFGLPDPAFSKVAQDGSANYPGVDPAGDWEIEEALDVEWAHAMAPAARVLLVEAVDNSDTNLYAAVDYAARQPGVAVVSMSFGGDEDPSEVGQDHHFITPAGHAGVTFVASSGDSGTIEYPAASPNVLSVGGTSLTLDWNNNYLLEFAWDGSGGGVSRFEPLPAYQQGVVGSGVTMRGNPDVAYDADPYTGFAVHDSYTFPYAPWLEVGGTSAGAPQWAALIAIADQGRAVSGLGTLDGASQTLPLLYGMGESPFHDVTFGWNLGGYAAGPGYDLVTGLGSPIAGQVVAKLAAPPTVTGTLTAQGVAIAPSAGQTFTGVVAVVTDTYPRTAAGNLQATIAWGDGHTSPGRLLGNADGTFGVEGTNTYARPGTYTVTITIQDTVHHQTAIATSTASVSPVTGSLSATGLVLNATAGLPFAGTVAVVLDSFAGVSAADLQATIAWGDGHNSAGTVTAASEAVYTITGTNTFVAAGSYQVAVTVHDGVNGLQVTVQGTAVVQDAGSAAASQPAPVTPDLTHDPLLGLFPGQHRHHRGRRAPHPRHGRRRRHRHRGAGT